MQDITTANEVCSEYAERRMIEEIKCKAKLDGFPANWTAEQVKNEESIKPVTGGAIDVDTFELRDGTGMGKAMLTFASVQDRKRALQLNQKN